MTDVEFKLRGPKGPIFPGLSESLRVARDVVPRIAEGFRVGGNLYRVVDVIHNANHLVEVFVEEAAE